MNGLLDNILAQSVEHLNIFLLMGLAIFFGTAGARIFQRFHIPQIVGYIVIGIILGPVLDILSHDTVVTDLKPLSLFALGVIGFMIGGELRADVLKKYGRQFFIILFSQGIGAFVLVAIGTSVAAWYTLPFILSQDTMSVDRLSISIALGLVLGAIASATAPAATVNVLWEYKTKGPLTAAVLAIVALDDALALLLYRCAATAADVLMGTHHNSVLATTFALVGEIFGAILLGFAAGVVFYLILKFVRADDKVLAFSIASLLLVVGISVTVQIGPIMPAMTLGVTIANLAPRRSKSVFALVEKFTPPIYVSFFVLAGAHMEFAKITWLMVLMIAVYVLCRAVGKIAGSWLGAVRSGAPAVLRRYLGICLLPQAGVAIGLAILASQQFNSQLGHSIVIVVMMGTFMMEILGPMLVKVGVQQAGEVGLNITEDDLIETHSVADVMDAKVPVISAGTSLRDVVQVVSGTDSLYYPVVDNDKKLIGAITLDGIRNTFATQELNDWLVALDIMEPVIAKTTPDIGLSEAFKQARRLDVEYMPVVASREDDSFVAVLNCRAVRRSLSAEVLSRQQKADNMASGQPT